ERLQALQQLLSAQAEAFNRRMAGRVIDVLFDRPGRQPGQILGRSPWMQPVHATGPARLVGSILPVRIDAGHAVSLAGQIVNLDPDDARPMPASGAVEAAA